MNTMIAEINTYTSTSKNLSMKSSALKALLSIWQRVNSRSESTADMEIAVSTSALQTLARGVIMRVCPGILVLGIALCVPGRNVSLAHEAQADDVLSVEKPWLTGTGTLATVTGQESPARMLHVPLAEAREDLHDSAKPERHIGSLTGEIPSGTLREEDAALKRRARLVGTRMRTLYGPEAAYQNAFIDAEEESGSRHIVAVMMPLTEVWEGAAFGHLSFFALKHGSHSAGRESLDLRFGMNPGRSFRPWFALTPYLNFGDAEGEGLGITAGMSQAWRKGADLSAEVFAWRPWDEGYYTIVEDGRKHGAALAITLPFTHGAESSTPAIAMRSMPEPVIDCSGAMEPIWDMGSAMTGYGTNIWSAPNWGFSSRWISNAISSLTDLMRSILCPKSSRRRWGFPFNMPFPRILG